MGSVRRPAPKRARFPCVHELRHRDGCEILLGQGRGFVYPGPVGTLIYARWQHYMEEGYDEAAESYIAGVLDGVRHRFDREVQPIAEAGCRGFILSDGNSKDR
jgi:hypothetical protein